MGRTARIALLALFLASAFVGLSRSQPAEAASVSATFYFTYENGYAYAAGPVRLYQYLGDNWYRGVIRGTTNACGCGTFNGLTAGNS
jgi:hypothetical protein